MSKKSKEKIGVQFYPITKEEIRQWYKDKLLSTAGYLLAIKKVTKMPGSHMVIPNVLQFCREWEISKSAFYRAVNELRQKGYTDWEATHGIILKETKKVVSFPSVEEKCPTGGTVSHERDSESHERENRGSKPSPDKNSRTPQILSDPIQTLSDRERESFIKFSRKKAASLPKPPELPMRWIKANFEELHSEWRETKIKKQNKKTKYSFELYSEPQQKMFYGQLQVVVESATERDDDTSLRRFFIDEFN
ncbi:MAG: hypothetical protein AAF757_32280, partial [Cyanobacteria bacterium P01_D01_bin.116]